MTIFSIYKTLLLSFNTFFFNPLFPDDVITHHLLLYVSSTQLHVADKDPWTKTSCLVLLILMLKKLYCTCTYCVLPADKIENALAYDDCDSLFYDIIKFLLQVRINLQ